MSKYDELFDKEAFDVERPIIEYEKLEVDLEECTCDFDEANCPIHGEEV
jgi:hypothetical protein